MINVKTTNEQMPEQVNAIKFNGENVNIVREEYIDDNGKKKYRNVWAKPLGSFTVYNVDSAPLDLNEDCHIYRTASKEPTVTISESNGQLLGADKNIQLYYHDSCEIRGGKTNKNHYVLPKEAENITSSDFKVNFYDPSHVYEFSIKNVNGYEGLFVKIQNLGNVALQLKNLKISIPFSTNPEIISIISNDLLNTDNTFEFYKAIKDLSNDVQGSYQQAHLTGEIQPYFEAITSDLSDEYDYGGSDIDLYLAQPEEPATPIISVKGVVYWHHDVDPTYYHIKLKYIAHQTSINLQIGRYHDQDSIWSKEESSTNEQVIDINTRFEHPSENWDCVLTMINSSGKKAYYNIVQASLGEFDSAPLEVYTSEDFK